MIRTRRKYLAPGRLPVPPYVSNLQNLTEKQTDPDQEDIDKIFTNLESEIPICNEIISSKEIEKAPKNVVRVTKASKAEECVV
ncbi:hypothetical protein CCACVL1_03853 [Corchorus capsularis]|uniref:Uncharacterized protein n=1 Tax=Corchorus capsularis TaxID=210143 RepID=A0A1R3JWV1_COCAP|nr:hypothetical protein CCACVL1_03853 [Corchorus capsularis]